MAFGAIIPDLDVVAYYGLYFFGFTIEQIHRTFLHTIFIPVGLFAIGLILYFAKTKISAVGKKHMTLPTIFFILSAGALLHLLLDATFAGQIIPLYPFSTFAIGLNLINIFPAGLRDLIIPSLDVALLIFWLFWMEFKLKISNYF